MENNSVAERNIYISPQKIQFTAKELNITEKEDKKNERGIVKDEK